MEIAIMRIRVVRGIIAKKRPDKGINVQFIPLVANEYSAQIVNSDFIELDKSNSEKVFLAIEKFTRHIEAGEIIVLSN